VITVAAFVEKSLRELIYSTFSKSSCTNPNAINKSYKIVELIRGKLHLKVDLIENCKRLFIGKEDNESLKVLN
jgi:hypothetical protein